MTAHRRDRLSRFRQAQESSQASFATVLAELGAGRKRSHWIWYIFPQLAGLGHSPTAVEFGLAGAVRQGYPRCAFTEGSL